MTSDNPGSGEERDLPVNEPFGPDGALRRTALAGGCIWIVCASASLRGLVQGYGLIELLLLFGPLVAVPGGLSMVAGSGGGGSLRGEGLAARLLLPAALCAMVARWSAPGLEPAPSEPIDYLSAGLSLPWLLVTVLVALLGLQRILKRGLAPIEETAIDAGLLYLPVGGGWLVLSSAGITPMNFKPEIVLLTAVHFHFAGFSAAVIAGLAGRALKGGAALNESLRPFALKAYRAAAGIVIIGPPLVAVGIMGSPIIEVISGIALSVGMLLLALSLVLIALSGHELLPKLLLCAAALSLTATMALSMTYATGEYLEEELISIATMVATHGVVNVLGFTLCGGLGLALLLRGRDGQ